MNKNIFVLCIVYVLNTHGMQQSDAIIKVSLTISRKKTKSSDIPSLQKATNDKLCKKFGVSKPESEQEWVKVEPLAVGIGTHVFWTENLPEQLARKFGNNGSREVDLPINKDFLHPHYLPAKYFKYLQGQKNTVMTTTAYGFDIIYHVKFQKTEEELKLESKENSRKTIQFIIGTTAFGIGLCSLIAAIIYYKLIK